MKTKKNLHQVRRIHPPYVVLTEEFTDLAKAVEYARSTRLWVYCWDTGDYIQPDLYDKGYYNEN